MSPPRLALVMGDAAGIGPELFVRLLAEPAVRARAAILGIGDARVLARGMEQAGVRPAIAVERDLDAALARATVGAPAFWDRGDCDPADCPPARVSAAAGLAALEAYRAALDLARAGRIEAFERIFHAHLGSIEALADLAELETLIRTGTRLCL
ncbi:MAG: hypothetical protein N3D77_06675, partial [Geminicoccaceae bacterium]|nr:hypothetical protein [Geminicoccaceae bacterium]